ncbi:MAG: hypothetical protein U9N45_05055 [Gemmatimonadota bacterium]|nr:hypothetical protein [Gemmatimonadota bacterium]
MAKLKTGVKAKAEKQGQKIKIYIKDRSSANRGLFIKDCHSRANSESREVLYIGLIYSGFPLSRE